MDIKDLNKKQLILLTLLITFVVSIATGIITVSLMQQMPKSVPQTINNVIQRTIEKVTTVPEATPAPTDDKTPTTTFADGDVLVSIYAADEPAKNPVSPGAVPPVVIAPPVEPKALGQGIIISDIGLILVDSSILNEKEELYKVTLNKINFDATVIKKFTNGFSILKISQKKALDQTTTDNKAAGTTTATPKVDTKQ